MTGSPFPLRRERGASFSGWCNGFAPGYLGAMIRRLLPLLATATALSCGRAAIDEDTSGSFQLDETTPRQAALIDAGAIARYCARDTVLSVWARQGDLIAAMAVRVPWPFDSARTISYTSLTEQRGTAMLALRPLRDSIRIASIAMSGTARLEPGPTLRLSFDATVPPTPPATDTAHWSGRVADVKVDADGCAGAQAP